MINIYRGDIKLNIKNYKLANIIRMMIFENKKYKLINDKIYDNITNEEIIFNDNEYDYINDYYKCLIPLWEDKYCNAKKYPDLYDDSKWIIGKRENKRIHQKLLILDNGFKFKIGYLWKHQPFNQRPVYGEHKKFVKTFRMLNKENNILNENENWGAILALTQQFIKDNAKEYYKDYTKKLVIQGYCKSEDTWFDIVEFDVLKNKWL